MKLSKIIGWIIIALWAVGVFTLIGIANGASFLVMMIGMAIALVIVGILMIGVWLITKD